MRRWLKSRSKENSRAGLGDAGDSKASLSAVSSKSSLVGGPGDGLGNPLEVPQHKVKPCKSLWDRAYDNLRNEKRELVDTFEKILMSEPEIEQTTRLDDGDTSKREKQMSALVDKKLEVMNNRQWRIKVCGRSVEVREQVDRIVKIVLVAKDFISSAATIDPLHAGLPWAGVCLLLPLVVNDSKQRTAAINGLENISALVRRYAEIERLYLQDRDLTLRGDFEAAVMTLYTQILEYEARATCQFSRNTALQIARNIVEADSWGDILGSIEVSEIACDKLMRIIDAEDQRARTKQVEMALTEQNLKVNEQLRVSRIQDKELLAEIRAMRKDQKESDKSKEEMDCLKSLRTTAYEYTMEKNPDRVPGTCEWFLHHRKYCEWLDESASSLLWVTADPGCGKSVLSKFLIDDYRSWMWKDTSICYFFFKDDSIKNKSAMHALCAILHQLFRQNHALLKHAVDEYKSNGNKLPQLFGSLWSILMKATADSNSGHIVCVIDALDECDESSCEQLIKHLAAFHSSTNLTTRIKFLITSRPNDFIRRVFFRYFSKHQDPASLKLMGENEREMEEISAEINLVIDAKVKSFMELRLLEYGIDDNTHIAIQEQLKKIKNRTYLWMALIFPELEKMVGYAEDDLLETIKRIPPTVDEAYERILANSLDVAKARRLLHIVCAASRPLTLIEMNRALSIDDNGSHRQLVPSKSFPNIVRDLCGLFVSIQHSRIYLIHQTAKEFLIPKNPIRESVRPVNSGKGSWKHSLEPIESNLILAKICISYLLLPVFEIDPLVIDGDIYLDVVEQIDRYINQHDILDYSAHNWATHFRVAEVKDQTILKSALEVCDTRSKRFQTWFEVYWNAGSPKMTDLTVASHFGHTVVVELLLQKGAEPDSKDNTYGQTPLSWAAENGHTTVVELLLQKGAELESKDENGRTPLSWAAGNGHIAVVELLLQKGAELEFKDESGWTPLSWAVENGHIAVVELLLQKGAELEFRGENGRTPLSWAAANGHIAVVELLLQKGAELESKDKRSRTPLSWAARYGDLAVVELLLQKGAELESKDKSGRTPLSWATMEGEEGVVELLLQKGAMLESEDDENTKVGAEQINTVESIRQLN